jgi:hypothetical protein
MVKKKHGAVPPPRIDLASGCFIKNAMCGTLSHFFLFLFSRTFSSFSAWVYVCGGVSVGCMACISVCVCVWCRRLRLDYQSFLISNDYKFRANGITFSTLVDLVTRFLLQFQKPETGKTYPAPLLVDSTVVVNKPGSDLIVTACNHAAGCLLNCKLVVVKRRHGLDELIPLAKAAVAKEGERPMNLYYA